MHSCAVDNNLVDRDEMVKRAVDSETQVLRRFILMFQLEFLILNRFAAWREV